MPNIRWAIGGVLTVVSALLLASTPSARADPIPGYDLDPAELARRMTACLERASPKDTVLMGWVSFRTGEYRHWRCSSLIHMIEHTEDRMNNNAHDPFVDVPAFMRCIDELASYGFPRPQRNGNSALYRQYNGTSSRAVAIVNDATGDIVTIYTEPRDNDWVGCADALIIR
jgi:hypothetical protein